MQYKKALTVKSPLRGVYVGRADENIALPLSGGMLLISAGDWVVWWPETLECEVHTDETIQNEYVIDEDIPPHMTHHIALMPSYDSWLSMCNQDEVNPQ